MCRSKWPRGLGRGFAAPSLPWAAGSNTAEWNGCLYRECCQVKVSARDWSHVQRSPTDCPIWTYGTELRVCACKSNNELIQRRQSKIPRAIVDAHGMSPMLWYTKTWVFQPFKKSYMKEVPSTPENYRVSIKSFPDYKHLLQENYCTWNTNFPPPLKM